MLEFDLPKNGLIVIGDLHGDMYSLLKILLKNGFPPRRKYLFLGFLNFQRFLIFLKELIRTHLLNVVNLTNITASSGKFREY